MKYACLFLALATMLGGCSSYGQRYNPADMSIPSSADVAVNMHNGIGPIAARYATMTIIAPNWALTNDHADGIAPGLVAEAKHLDVALVHIDDGKPVAFEAQKDGVETIQYGTGANGEPRVAHGRVVMAYAALCYGSAGVDDVIPSMQLCRDHGKGTTPSIYVVSDAGDGFSGGPVYDVATGGLIGVMQGDLYLTSGSIPGVKDGERAFSVVPIGDAIRAFFPGGDVSKDPILTSDTSKPAEPDTWAERNAWVIALLLFGV